MTPSEISGLTDESVGEYLRTLGFAEGAVPEQAFVALRQMRDLCPEPILSVFLSQESEDGSASSDPSSLWAFSTSFCLQARDILLEGSADFDISPIGGAVTYVGIETRGIPDLSLPTANSQMTIEMQTTGRIYNSLGAVGANCSFLYDIVKRYLVANLSTRVSDQPKEHQG